MRKIIVTLGASALMSTVLAVSAPMAAHAVTPKDTFCSSALANFNTLNGQLQTAKNTLNTDVSTANDKLALLSGANGGGGATGAAATAAAAFVDAQTNGGDVTTTKTNLDNATAAFATAANNWLNAHIAAVNDRNFVEGTIFKLDFVVQSSNNVGCPTPLVLVVPSPEQALGV
ncbi:MAG: hypothetical protein ACR2LJ_04585 [Acidimicrobiales bacterium]